MVQYKKQGVLLSANNINLTYGDKHILRDINFKIEDIIRPDVTQGQIVSIVGRSGIGKSSLFNLISGWTKPTSGEILIGLDQNPVEKGNVGVVPQDYLLFNHRTLYENLSIALRDNKDKKDIITEYVSFFDLGDQLKKYPCDLSGGQRQRASILQQILAGNQYILMDEPFSGLDVLVKNKVLDLLLKVSNISEMNTLIIVSHDIISSCAISDTVFVMANEEGKLGATITKTYDFIEMGLAYQPNIKHRQDFHNVIAEIESIL